MASEVNIRAAIAAVITSATASVSPAPVVIPRDILNIFESGWMNVLRDQSGAGVIHGWSVTQTGAAPVPGEERGYGAEYELIFDVWQWFQYASGTNASNSENSMSAERELVIAAFAKPLQSPVSAHSELSRVKPLEFPPGSIGTPELEFSGQVRLARGILRVGQLVGCE